MRPTNVRTAAQIEAAVEAVSVDTSSTEVKEPLRFLSRSEVARYLGLAGLHSLTGVELPDPPDALIGNRKGWTKETIDEWNSHRPGRGRWGARDGNVPLEPKTKVT